MTPGVTIRLPDKYTGLFIAYALDMYGLNPSMLMGLSAKESFFTAVMKDTDDGSYFIVDDSSAHYSCYEDDRVSKKKSQRGVSHSFRMAFAATRTKMDLSKLKLRQ